MNCLNCFKIEFIIFSSFYFTHKHICANKLKIYLLQLKLALILTGAIFSLTHTFEICICRQTLIFHANNCITGFKHSMRVSFFLDKVYEIC